MYHYAGNNPVKYTDPDGNESFCPLFGFSNPIGELFNFIAQNSSGSDKLVASTVAAANGNAESAYRLEKLSPYMCEAMSKASGEAVFGGMEFVSDYGSVVAVAAYASGNVELGLVIDGLTFSCDITLSVMAYQKSEQKSEDMNKLVSSISSTVLTTAVGLYSGDKINKNLSDKLMNSKIVQQIANSSGDLISSFLVTMEDAVNEIDR